MLSCRSRLRFQGSQRRPLHWSRNKKAGDVPRSREVFFSLNKSLHRDWLGSSFSSLDALKKDRSCLSLLMFQSLAWFYFSIC